MDVDGKEEDAERQRDEARRGRARTPRSAYEEEEEYDEDVEVLDEGADVMATMMGFGGFGSTKGKKVAGNDVGAVRKEKKSEYRQYMNRIGGFNRPLSPTR